MKMQTNSLLCFNFPKCSIYTRFHGENEAENVTFIEEMKKFILYFLSMEALKEQNQVKCNVAAPRLGSSPEHTHVHFL